jgi:hypothetical protein
MASGSGNGLMAIYPAIAGAQVALRHVSGGLVNAPGKFTVG